MKVKVYDKHIKEKNITLKFFNDDEKVFNIKLNN